MRKKWLKCRCVPVETPRPPDDGCECLLLLPTQPYNPSPVVSYGRSESFVCGPGDETALQRELEDESWNEFVQILGVVAVAFHKNLQSDMKREREQLEAKKRNVEVANCAGTSSSQMDSEDSRKKRRANGNNSDAS